MAPVRPLTRSLRVGSATAFLLVGLVACGGGHGAKPAPTTQAPRSSTSASPATTATTAAVARRAPLTGLPMSDPAVLGRPAVIVKIDNAPEARPQSSLDKADLIIEEKVEGGLSRFMAVFQSEDGDPIGPIRSVRSTDPPVVRPIGGVFAYSGGTAPFVQALHGEGGVVDGGVDAHPELYYRRSGRYAPHDLYSNVSALRKLAPAGATPPPPLFTYLAPGQAFGAGRAVPSIHARVPLGLTTGEWGWDPTKGTWQRWTDGSPHTVDGGGTIGFTNVVIQLVPYHNTGYIDPARAPVDMADVVGSGEGWALSDGRALHVHWSKPSITDVTAWSDDTGAAVALNPGRTWLTLAPIGAAVSIDA